MPADLEPVFATFEELSAIEQRTLDVPIVMKKEVGFAWRDAQDAYTEALRAWTVVAQRSGVMVTEEEALKHPDVAEAKRKADELQGPMLAVTRVVRLRDIGRAAYLELKLEHPPTPEDDVEWEARFLKAPYCEDTFLPALVAECSLKPKLTPEQVAVLWDDLSIEDVSKLGSAALNVCAEAVGDLPKA